MPAHPQRRVCKQSHSQIKRPLCYQAKQVSPRLPSRMQSRMQGDFALVMFSYQHTADYYHAHTQTQRADDRQPNHGHGHGHTCINPHLHLQPYAFTHTFHIHSQVQMQAHMHTHTTSAREPGHACLMVPTVMGRTAELILLVQIVRSQ